MQKKKTKNCVKWSFSRPYIDLWDAYKVTLLSWVSHLAWRVLWYFSVCGQWLGVTNIKLLLRVAKELLCSCCCTALTVLRVDQEEDWHSAELEAQPGRGEAEQKLGPCPQGSTGEADTGKSAAVWTLCEPGTRGAVGFSCKMLSAENAESLPAFEGQFQPHVRAVSCQKFQTRCSCSAFSSLYPGIAQIALPCRTCLWGNYLRLQVNFFPFFKILFLF